jgi:hypothetical protein
MLRIRDPAQRMRRITLDDEEEEEALEAAISRRQKKRKTQRCHVKSSSSIDETRFSSASVLSTTSDYDESPLSSNDDDYGLLEVPEGCEAAVPAPTHHTTSFGFQQGRVTRREATPSSIASDVCVYSLHDVKQCDLVINPAIYTALDEVPCGGEYMEAIMASLKEDLGFVLVNDGDKVISLRQHLKLLYRVTWFVIIVNPFHPQTKVFSLLDELKYHD